MPYDAIILAGGRSSRLQGNPKAQLSVGGRTLLEITLAAASGARSIVVVGDAAALATPDERVQFTREDPPFSGPAAALGAGLALLSKREPAEYTLVLACDMPGIAAVVPVLIGELRPGSGGVIALDGQRPQFLAAVYHTARLDAAVAEQRAAGTLDGQSVRALVSALGAVTVPAPPGSTDDIDTWADAAQYGIPEQPPRPTEELP